MPDTLKLPKIREDPKTGKRYVIVGKKRVWLAKGVGKKELLKFLFRYRRKVIKKKATQRKRSATAKQKELVSRVFGENVSTVVAGKARNSPRFDLTSPRSGLSSMQRPRT